MRSLAAACASLVVALSVATPAPLAAQCGIRQPQSACDYPDLITTNVDPTKEVAVAALNVGIGGVTAGVWQKLRGGSFRDGFVRGALGGTLVWAGKRTAAESFDASGVLGRGIAAVGSSIVENAAAARPTFSQVVIPVALLRVYVFRDSATTVRAKLDLPATLATVVSFARSDLRFDAASSLRAGAPVFLAEGRPDDTWHGRHVLGVIYLRDPAPTDERLPPPRRLVLRHEVIHSIQSDFAHAGWGEPAETWLLHAIPGGRWLDAWADIGVHYPVVGALGETMTYADRPWEREARFFTRW